MDNRKYNAIIIDDHPIVIEGLKKILESIEIIKITATFTSGKSIFSYADLKDVDIVFLDIFLKDCNGIDICQKLKKNFPDMIILAMSSQSERSIILQMLQSGASGYLLKSASLLEYKNCIIGASEGKTVFCNQVQEIVEKVSVEDFKTIPRLTIREKEILELLKDGKSTQEISDKLFLSYLTVQTHRRNLLSKYQVKNVVELLNCIKENGLL